jgi:hypothetical protein
MSHLVLSDVAPELMEELRRRADSHGHSLDEEAKSVLAGALGLSKARVLGTARRLRVRVPGPASAELLRLARER